MWKAQVQASVVGPTGCAKESAPSQITKSSSIPVTRAMICKRNACLARGHLSVAKWLCRSSALECHAASRRIHEFIRVEVPCFPDEGTEDKYRSTGKGSCSLMFIVLASHGGLRASGFSWCLTLTHDTEGEYRVIGKGLRCQLSH